MASSVIMQFFSLIAFVALLSMNLVTIALAENSLCPKGWTYVRPHCWKYDPRPMTWPEARFECRSQEAELVSIHNEHENQLLTKFIDRVQLTRKLVRVKRKPGVVTGDVDLSCFEKHPSAILVGYAEVALNTSDVNGCLKECLNAQSAYKFKCNSVMYYRETRDCILNVETRSTKPDLFLTDTNGATVDYYDNKCDNQPTPVANSNCFQVYPGMALVGFAEQVFNGVDAKRCEQECLSAQTKFNFYCRSFMHYKKEVVCIINLESRQTRPDLFATDSEAEYYERGPCRTFPGCQNTAMDLFFIVDSSSSIGQQGFENMRQFLKTIVSAFTVGPNETFVGLVQFNENPMTEFHLKSYQTNAEVLAAIDSIQWMGGHTLIGRAMTYALDNELVASQGDRTPNVPDVVIVLTDGLSQDNPVQPAQLMRSTGVITYAVGVTEAVLDEQLMYIAGSMERVYKVKDFSQLDSRLRDQIVRDICNPSKPMPPPLIARPCIPSPYTFCGANLPGYIATKQPAVVYPPVVKTNPRGSPLMRNQWSSDQNNSTDGRTFEKSTLRLPPVGVWLGITDQFKEGIFKWVDNTVVNYSNWKLGQPDGGPIENCVLSLYEPMPRWIDTKCSSRNPSMCKMFPSRKKSTL